MIRKLLFIAFLLYAFGCTAGNVGQEDRQILRRFWQYAVRERLETKGIAERVGIIARFFVGTPYASGTLEVKAEVKAEELPIVNLRAFDCVTFVENVLALAYLEHYGNGSEQAFVDNLRKIRYRDGRIGGYASRLHYSSDWLYEMGRQGLLTDVTKFAGGVPYNKRVGFMTKNADRYPVLKASPNERAQMKKVEDAINSRSYYYIPKHAVKRACGRIREGDVVLITTTLKGLDTSHLGFAVKQNGKTYLLHASSAGKHVMLTAKPLDAYMAEISSQSGIMLGRARRGK